MNQVMNNMLHITNANSQICRKSSNNKTKLFVGKCEQLFQAFKSSVDLQTEFQITHMESKEDSMEYKVEGFKVDGKKKRSDAPPFFCKSGEEYAWYMKAGWDVMFAMTPLHQFTVGRTFGKQSVYSPWGNSESEVLVCGIEVSAFQGRRCDSKIRRY